MAGVGAQDGIGVLAERIHSRPQLSTLPWQMDAKVWLRGAWQIHANCILEAGEAARAIR